MISVGSKVIVEKGCRANGIDKGVRASVKAIEPLGPDYNHLVRVTLFFLNGFKSGKTVALYARHANRLSDPLVSLSDVRPEHKIQVRAA